MTEQNNIESQPRDIMHYESDIWAIADLLLAASVKQSDFPAYMMPFFALMMLEGRMLNAMKLVEEEEGLTVKDDSSIFVTILSERKVCYEGEETSISALSAKLKGYKVKHIQPTPNWLFNDRLLSEIYDETYPFEE